MDNTQTNVFKHTFLTLSISLIFTQVACIKPTEPKITTEPCKLEAKDLPSFRGLKLEMPLKLKENKFSTYFLKEQNIFNASELGYKKQYFHPDFEPFNLPDEDKTPKIIDKKDLDDVTLETLDEKLVKFEIEYDDSIQWSSINQVVEKFADTFKLQRQDFKVTSYSSAEVECKDFSVNIKAYKDDNLNQRRLALKVEKFGVAEILSERDKKRREQKQSTFTP
jgi:hypothetical protein